MAIDEANVVARNRHQRNQSFRALVLYASSIVRARHHRKSGGNKMAEEGVGEKEEGQAGWVGRVAAGAGGGHVKETNETSANLREGIAPRASFALRRDNVSLRPHRGLAQRRAAGYCARTASGCRRAIVICALPFAPLLRDASIIELRKTRERACRERGASPRMCAARITRRRPRTIMKHANRAVRYPHARGRPHGASSRRIKMTTRWRYYIAATLYDLTPQSITCPTRALPPARSRRHQ